MRLIQVCLFVLAGAALIAALFFIGTDTALDLWRAGMACLALDIVAIMLWPGSPERG